MVNRKRKLDAILDSEEANAKRNCEFCLLSFNRNDRLQTHILNNHVPQICRQCNLEFSNQIVLKKHMKKNHGQKTCTVCQLSFKKKIQLERHILNKHEPMTCGQCNLKFSNRIELKKHMQKTHRQKKHHKIKTRVSEKDEHISNEILEEDESSEQIAFNKLLLTKCWRIRGAKDPLTLMSGYKKNITHHLIPLLIKNPQKIYIVMDITMVKKSREGKVQRITSYFHSSTRTILRSAQINPILEESSQQINSAFDNFTQKGSGWILESIDYLKLYTAVYEPIRGKSYIPTPESIALKKSCD